VALLAGCGEAAKLAPEATTGPRPQLAEPNKTLIPTVNVATAVGWTDTAAPTPARLRVTALARGLDHPRWVYTLPNGDVLVAESNKPPKPGGSTDGGSGLMAKVRNWVMGKVMGRAGAGVPSANRITLLRDADGDGVAEVKQVFMTNLMSPYGMALVGNELFIANADALVKVPYTEGQTSSAPTHAGDELPAGINHHWTKNVIANADGSKLYVTVGSNSNIGENGLAAEEGRAAIWEVDTEERREAPLRERPAQPQRHGLGPRHQGAVDRGERARRDRQRPRARLPHLGEGRRLLRLALELLRRHRRCARHAAEPRDGGQGHRARLRARLARRAAGHGLLRRARHAVAASRSSPAAPSSASTARGTASPSRATRWCSCPSSAASRAGRRWRRRPHRLRKRRPGLTADEKAQGRPVGVALDKSGALLVADDVGNAVWRVSRHSRSCGCGPHQNPASTTLPCALPLSMSACAS
jgi:glucose/arabinose dehydrogenase